jgi:hypothetical protein
VLPYALFDSLVLSQQTYVCIVLKANGDVCTGSGSCVNIGGIVGGVVAVVVLLLIGVGIQVARSRRRAAANLAIINQGVIMQPTNFNQGAPQSTNQVPSGLVTVAK